MLKTNKRQIIAIIAIVIASVMIMTVILIAYSTSERHEKRKDNNSFINDFSSEFDMTFNNSPFIELCSVTEVTYSATDNTMRKTLTATVYPESAINKKVDWTVAWAEEGNEEIVTEYVTVEPESVGSTTATVICFKPFTKDIVVTVTTIESGYSATCMVTYKGIPTDITVSTDVNYDGESVSLGIGETYMLNVDSTNIFNQVGAEYQELNVTLECIGAVILSTQDYYRETGTIKWYDSADVETPLGDIQEEIITMTYENGVISLTTKKAIESYYSSSSIIDGGRTIHYKNKFRQYVGETYFLIKISQLDCGLTKSIKINFDETLVTGVTTSKTQIYF